MPDLHDQGFTIENVDGGGAELATVRDLCREYWDSLGLSADFQNFEKELDSLPGPYDTPGGRLLLARIQHDPAGTIAMKRLDERSCEAKRLYVRPQYRGKGLATALLEKLLLDARDLGYTQMYCDTLKTMTAALNMYTQLGFAEVDPYSANPTPNAIYLRLSL
jgi:carbonic anhydrase